MREHVAIDINPSLTYDLRSDAYALDTNVNAVISGLALNRTRSR